METWQLIIILAISLPVGFVLIMQLLNLLSKPPATINYVEVDVGDLANVKTGVSTRSKDPKKRISAIPYRTDLHEAKEKIKELLFESPRVKIIKESENYLYFTDTSLINRWVDDIELVFDEDKKHIHYRSGPRYGLYDFNTNRSRFEVISAKFQNKFIETNSNNIPREQIPPKELNILISINLMCSLLIVSFYIIWIFAIPEFYRESGIPILLIDVLLSVFSFLIVLLLFKQKSLKSTYNLSIIWIIILIAFGIWSEIYPIIGVAIIQLVIDIRFYKILNQLRDQRTF